MKAPGWCSPSWLHRCSPSSEALAADSSASGVGDPGSDQGEEGVAGAVTESPGKQTIKVRALWPQG